MRRTKCKILLISGGLCLLTALKKYQISVKMRRTKRKILLVSGGLCLLAFIIWKHIFTPRGVHEVAEKLPIRKKDFVYSPGECQKDISVDRIAGSNNIPQHIQDFLYYQHCRHFPMLLDSPDKCGGADKSDEVFLLLVIKSSPGNYERREVLRKTWARERKHNGLWIRRIFISGTTGDGFEKIRLNNLLEVEQRDYSDILQWDFTDTLFNLTLKQILFLEWWDKNCRNARFLLNGDDDVFAHTDNMVEYLQSLKDNNGSRHLFTGFLIQGTGPVRWTKSKYYVPVQVQESNSYPPYCGGGGYLLSAYTAAVIRNMSHSIALHPIDDAYMGMCLAKAGLSPTSHLGFWTLGLTIPSKNVDLYDPCFYKDLLLVHRFLPAQIYLMWDKIFDPNLKCSRPIGMRCRRKKSK